MLVVFDCLRNHVWNDQEVQVPKKKSDAQKHNQFTPAHLKLITNSIMLIKSSTMYYNPQTRIWPSYNLITIHLPDWLVYVNGLRVMFMLHAFKCFWVRTMPLTWIWVVLEFINSTCQPDMIDSPSWIAKANCNQKYCWTYVSVNFFSLWFCILNVT